VNRRTRIVLDTLLPSGAHPELSTGLIESGWERFEERYRREATPLMVLGYRMALLVAIWVAPLLLARPPPISLYRAPTRTRILAAMEGSRIKVLRDMTVVLKTTVALWYGALPEVRRALGHPRPREIDRDDGMLEILG
jgi:hypothetical protein